MGRDVDIEGHGTATVTMGWAQDDVVLVLPALQRHHDARQPWQILQWPDEALQLSEHLIATAREARGGA